MQRRARVRCRPRWTGHLLDDAVDRGEAEPGTFARPLGGEERLEQVRPDAVGDPRSVIADGDPDVRSRRGALVCLDVRHVEVHVAGLERDHATVRHRVARIDHEVHHHLFDLSGVGVHAATEERARTSILVDCPAQKGSCARPRRSGQDLGLKHLPAAEGQQLGRQRGCAAPGVQDFLQIGVRGMRRLELIQCQLGEAHDHRQQIVEVMSHAGRELSDGFHLLRLPGLLFDVPPFGDVLDDRDEVGRLAGRVAIRVDRDAVQTY